MTVSTSLDGVYTDLRSLSKIEGRSRRVTFLPRQPAHSLLSGPYASRLRGRGVNFEEIRGYLPGDDVRSIDWKVTARLQHPHIRVFNEERDRQTLLIVDQRLSMFFGSRKFMKSVTAAETAALIAWRTLAAGDRVGGIVFNDTKMTEIRPQRSHSNVLRLLGAIVKQNRSLGVNRGIERNSDMLNRAVSRARGLAPHDATVILISDFDGADTATRKMASAMTSHIDLIALLIHDPLQSELPPARQMVVTDGRLQAILDTTRAKTRQDILNMSKDRIRDVLSWTPDLQIPVLPIGTADDAGDQIRHLLGHLQGRRRSDSGRSAAHG